MQVFAHRGSSIIWPENTLLAFRLAHEAGAGGFETDLRLSGDGEIVLSHDPELGRFGHHGVVVSRSAASTLCGLEVSSPDGAMHDRMTTLRALLQTYPDKEYIFDCKVGDRALFEKLRDLLSELRFHDRIRFLTWSRAADSMVAELFPGHLRYPSYRRSVIWGALSMIGLGRLVEPRSCLLSLPTHHRGIEVFRPGQIRSLRARGKLFMGYLVNTRGQYMRCVECGVASVLTDRPDIICPLAGRA